MRILCFLGVLACVAGGPAMAQTIDFGDDSGQWSNDGECDDPRFEGPGMTTTPLLDSDIRADATDCRTAFKAGMLTLRSDDNPADMIVGGVNFGNDEGEWSNDGECDDMRFAGPGMTGTMLLSDDIMRDASDCRAAFQGGLLTLAGE